MRKVAHLAGGRVDILLGCPPCQGFSDTGNRDPRDPRNCHIGLFRKFVSKLKPLAVVMENVPLLATSSRFVAFTHLLERYGYQWTAAIVNAALYGSCQTRQRLVPVAIHNSVGTIPPYRNQPTEEVVCISASGTNVDGSVGRPHRIARLDTCHWASQQVRQGSR